MAAATSEQLKLLHRELIALTRAGVPLDRGLRQLAADLPGGLGRLAHNLAAQLERGQPLEEVLTSSRSPEQRVYAAVVAAGLRSGDLNGALEGIVRQARASGELRRSLWAEMLYPVILLLIGIGLVQFSFQKLWPVNMRMSEKFDTFSPWMDWVTYVGLAWIEWGWTSQLFVAGAVVLFGVLLAWGTSLRSTARRGGPLHTYRVSHSLARFCDLLALMIDRSVPLPDALRLAGEAAGWKPLAQAAAQMSQRLQNGEPPQAMPPLPETVVWLLGSNAAGRTEQLRREAKRYRAKAARQAKWLATWLPLIATVVIGGGLVVLLAVVDLGPLLNLLHRLSRADQGN